MRGRRGYNEVVVRVYLDASCLNRPDDDQEQARIRLETEAISIIMERFDEGQWLLQTGRRRPCCGGGIDACGRIADLRRSDAPSRGEKPHPVACRHRQPAIMAEGAGQ